MQANQSCNASADVPMIDGDGYANDNSALMPNGAYLNGAVANGTPLQPRVALSAVDQDIIRIIAQHLRILGMNHTVDQLAAESGCVLEHPTAAKFRNHVMNGDWPQILGLKELIIQAIDHMLESYSLCELFSRIDAEEDLLDMENLVNDRGDIIKMKFLMLEQKYLELLEDGLLMDALNCLRNQVTPLKYNTEHVHKLSTYLMCSTAEDLRAVTKWVGKGPASRLNLMEKLQVFLPSNVMIPQRRLQELLQQALLLQTQNCRYHNFVTPLSLDSVSLLTNHVCNKDQFPCVTRQILSDHADEVLHCKFSPDGTMLATGSKDGVLIIYDIDMVTHKLTQRKQYPRHRNGVAFISWSPDSQFVIVCGPIETTEIVILNIVTGEQHMKMNQTSEDSLTTAAWHVDGKKIVAAGIKGQFFQCNMEGGNSVETWPGVRIQCVQCMPDGKTVLGADTHNRIRGYNFDDLTETNYFKEDHSIMSFSLNKAGTQVLLNVASQGVHLWDLSSKILVRKFQGVTQGYFLIYSCFGGANENFVASGSEDQKVYMWHINREEPIASLEGHSRGVNCTDWNPVIHSMLASASDDATVRIWGPALPDGSPTPATESTPSTSSKFDGMSSCDSSEDMSAV